jgi:predicted Zn finger-like uncharacterized protein
VYTQCSNCETVFKLSADVLRAAGGQVRCGRCGEVFSALARLAEDPSAFTAHETHHDLEERADSILRSTPGEPSTPNALQIEDSDAGDGIEIAHLQILDFSSEDLASATGKHVAPPPDAAEATAEEEALGENSMEFTLPPGELDRIFVESKTGVAPPFPLVPSAKGAAPAKNKAPQRNAQPKPAVTAPAPQPVAPNPFVPHKAVTSAPAAAAASTPASLPSSDPDEGPLPDIEVVRDNRVRTAATGGPLVSELARRQLQASVDPAEFDLGKKPSPLSRSNGVWLTAAICCAALLAGQMVHHNREWLAAHAPFGSLLRSLYTTIGAPVSTPANLAAYQLRQWGVTGDPGADGTLKVRASILNTTAQLVPFPLLRVTLANRYGTRMGARDFEPSEYLGKPTARLIAPGERVDATLQIRDPGKDAEGFEIDVCLRTTDRKIICANDAAAPQVKS